MLRPAMRAVLVVLCAFAFARPAAAQPHDQAHDLLLRNPVRDQPKPVVELVTMGIGSLIWERHGHIALCVVYDDDRDDRCYNYGIGDFQHPLGMVAGFFRGTHSFWAGEMDPDQMLSIYVWADRTIWVQPLLNLKPPQVQEVIAKVKSDILEDNKFYAYDHFWDNCTSRVRDILDHATGGELSALTNQTDGRTYRDLARAGFFGMRVPLLVTDLAMGRVTDREPTYFERMFLPDYLREAVKDGWKIRPIPVYERRGDPPLTDGPSGRVLFALFILLLTAPAWATRLWGRFQRTGLAIAVSPAALLGLIFWVLAIISPLPYVRWNETCLVLMPFDWALLFLSPARARKYARARVIMLAIVAALLAVGVLKQPLWSALLWPLVPAATVAFWKDRETKPSRDR
jgi:hypothetical protein